jgi:hypothetical protein
MIPPPNNGQLRTITDNYGQFKRALQKHKNKPIGNSDAFPRDWPLSGDLGKLVNELARRCVYFSLGSNSILAICELQVIISLNNGKIHRGDGFWHEMRFEPVANL